MTKKEIYVYFSGNYNNPDGTAKLVGNLGDISGYYIIEHIIKNLSLDSEIKLIPINQKSPQITLKNITVISIIGSILNHAIYFKDNKNSFFLGCGSINGNKINNENYNTNIIGVRGELTKNSILNNKDIDITSDFGLLLSEIYPINEKPTKKIGYIIHSVDREYFFNEYPDLKDNLVDNYKEPDIFVKELLKYDKIVSSSLHGIIFSHSYGKSVVPVKLGDRINGQDFKFKDYYSSIGLGNMERIPLETKIDDFEVLFDSKYEISVEKINQIKTNQIDKLSSFIKIII